MCALIAESEGRRDEKSGYARLFGSQGLGHLLSRAHATVIRAGNELERIIKDKCPFLSTLGEVLQTCKSGTPTRRCSVVPNAKASPRDLAGGKGIKVDFVVVDWPARRAYVVELKDGDTFDTKKASGEVESLERFASFLTTTSGLETIFKFCCFHQDDKSAIVAGAKNRFGLGNAMTGREFCELVGVSYDQILALRRPHAPQNFEYFLNELMKIPEVRTYLLRSLGPGT
jgi:hypothetical protein